MTSYNAAMQLRATVGIHDKSNRAKSKAFAKKPTCELLSDFYLSNTPAKELLDVGYWSKTITTIATQIEKKQFYCALIVRDIEKVSNEELKNNLEKLLVFSRMKAGWDGYQAEEISIELIKKARDILVELYKQPEIFPTAAGTIQLEYDGPNNSYLEFQLHEEGQVDLFFVISKGKEHTERIDMEGKKINTSIMAFYEQYF